MKKLLFLILAIAITLSTPTVAQAYNTGSTFCYSYTCLLDYTWSNDDNSYSRFQTYPTYSRDYDTFMPFNTGFNRPPFPLCICQLFSQPIYYPPQMLFMTYPGIGQPFLPFSSPFMTPFSF